MKYVKLVDLYGLFMVATDIQRPRKQPIGNFVIAFLKAHFFDWLLLNEHQNLQVLPRNTV